ncbi:hypothetical protein ACGFYA_34770 [Streptomyces sp. NPDC048305]|uniref:hypothetical protein n=1 Tax=Streptomyces sp. NPDC048305 TaxID=3365532 RepID=UPI0037140683
MAMRVPEDASKDDDGLHDLVEAVGGTFITFTQEGGLTWDRNSDSDTDHGGQKVGGRAEAMDVDSDTWRRPEPPPHALMN